MKKVPQVFGSLLREFMKIKLDLPGEDMSSVNALQVITHADVHGFKKRHREVFQDLEQRLTGVLERLHDDQSYRVLGLYIALLVHDINLVDYCRSRLLKGPSGESAARITAMVRQAIHAQGIRQGRLPVWATSLIGALVGIVMVLLLLIAILAFVTSQLS